MELDFKHNKTQQLTLEELKETQHEDLSNGNPVGGIYHFNLLETLLSLCHVHGLNPQIASIVAADNQDKYRPGVTINERIEKEYGEGCFKSHTLRRICATIEIKDFADEEHGYYLVVSYYQKGISVGFGPHARVCSNMMILGSDHVFSTMAMPGMGKLKNQTNDVDCMLKMIDAYLDEAPTNVKLFKERLTAMQSAEIGYEQVNDIFVSLMKQRIAYDSPDKCIHDSLGYALSQKQINAALTRYMKQESSGSPVKTVYDFYQVLNYDLKAAQTEIPQLLPQSVRLFDTIMEKLKN